MQGGGNGLVAPPTNDRGLQPLPVTTLPDVDVLLVALISVVQPTKMPMVPPRFFFILLLVADPLGFFIWCIVNVVMDTMLTF